ncbi:hypothetical protein DdX_22102 [Ditylenchus destructor]|uniref:Uncharacterized protein n=1 Tax=Ditylenchus destructor TaxID=166010 RepID=A0AAD4ME28_9BILA|nr:hypothetical protein DdX_22102 [Ditylenchus destructor]
MRMCLLQSELLTKTMLPFSALPIGQVLLTKRRLPHFPVQILCTLCTFTQVPMRAGRKPSVNESRSMRAKDFPYLQQNLESQRKMAVKQAGFTPMKPING